MGRRGLMHKKTINNNPSVLETLEMIENPMIEEPQSIISEGFVLLPNVNYNQISDEIKRIEEMSKKHVMSSPSGEEITILRPNPPKVSPIQLQAAEDPKFIPIDSSRTGREAIGKPLQAAPVLNEIIRKKLQLPHKEEIDESTLPPINEDFLSFLIEKKSNSFGWVVDTSFLGNFSIDPSIFTESEQFIFWFTPKVIKVHTVATAGGFMNAPSVKKTTVLSAFFIKILDVPKGHEGEDPYIGIINDPRYLLLREKLEERGIDFFYDHNPGRIWSYMIADKLEGNI